MDLGRRVVIVAGADAASVGTLVAELDQLGVRAAAFVGDAASAADAAALLEMVTELFPMPDA